MKKIAELTDKDLLGQLGEAHSAPRYKTNQINLYQDRHLHPFAFMFRANYCVGSGQQDRY